MKVLIIDDVASIRESTSNILSDENISSKTAKSLEEAKKILTKEYFPVILLDIWLEDGSGIDFIDTIKELSPNSSIVMITGHGGIELAVQSIKRELLIFRKTSFYRKAFKRCRKSPQRTHKKQTHQHRTK